MDQPKIERLLRLMKMLTANVRYSVEDLATRFEVSVRTIYRYIDTFREAGFVIKNNDTIYRIDKSSPYFKDISSLVHFTEEEAYILKSAIESIDETNLLKQNLKRKLYTVYEYKILAETVFKGRHAGNVNKLVEAMEEQKQVVLRGYSSAHSSNVTDRLVEAFSFTTNYIQIWAYEPESDSNKLFKISRINQVEILPQKWQYRKLHKAGHIDIFRVSSHELIPITLKLSLRAAMLLMEEYPLAERDMKELPDNEWLLETHVCSLEGVGRFVLGLPGEVAIVDTPRLLDFIEMKKNL